MFKWLSVWCICVVAVSASAEEAALGPDSLVQDGVPVGVVTKHEWRSKVFEGTVRDYYIYVPAQYDKRLAAHVMVFQDGHAYVKLDGQVRVPTVFDNLIHKKEMPVTIGVFVNPGHLVLNGEGKRPKSPWKSSNRSVEYDTLSSDYATFLIDEILPEVGKSYTLTTNASERAICGMSSGGICAFTVAWERPDAFQKVISHIGSFTNIRGGDRYPGIIRKAELRPIRVFLQDGSNDLNNQHGNWWLGNQQMMSALEFREYDVRFVKGEGGHSGKHGGAIFPDTLRWIWRK